MSPLKTALISGSSKGIGKAIAIRLAQEGRQVIITGRNETEVQETARACGKNALAFVGDLTTEEVQKNLFEWIDANQLSLELFVANLGSGRSISGGIVPLEEYRRIMDLNLFSTIALSNLSCERMQKKGSGQVITIASIAGCEEVKAPIPYTIAKSALLAFTKALSTQMAGAGVRVNAISPGNVLCEGGSWEIKLSKSPEKVKAYIQDNVALNRFILPEEIAKTVLFLEDNTAITGANIVVDAGQIRRLS